MRTLILLIFALSVISCSEKKSRNYAKITDTIERKTFPPDTLAMLHPVSNELLISERVCDSDIISFSEKCAVFVLYSENELAEMKKKYQSEDDWNAFYDDLSFYTNEASQFLSSDVKLESVSQKKYIQFHLVNGTIITIDRKKAEESILFFNPQSGIKQCEYFSFDKEKYKGF